MYYSFCERKLSQAVTKLSLDCNVWHLAVPRRMPGSERSACPGALLGAPSTHLHRGEGFPLAARSVQGALAPILPVLV